MATPKLGRGTPPSLIVPKSKLDFTDSSIAGVQNAAEDARALAKECSATEQKSSTSIARELHHYEIIMDEQNSNTATAQARMMREHAS